MQVSEDVLTGVNKEDGFEEPFPGHLQVFKFVSSTKMNTVGKGEGRQLYVKHIEKFQIRSFRNRVGNTINRYTWKRKCETGQVVDQKHSYHAYDQRYAFKHIFFVTSCIVHHSITVSFTLLEPNKREKGFPLVTQQVQIGPSTIASLTSANM